jgi:hypothetical protein
VYLTGFTSNAAVPTDDDGPIHGKLLPMLRRFTLVFLAAMSLTACDGYIEEARVSRDGSVEFAARAIIVCSDPLQQEIWGGDPCPAIDAAIRTGEISDTPLGFAFDPNRVSLVGTGEIDRRTIDVSWDGAADELETLLVRAAQITPLDDLRTEATFVPAGAPVDELLNSTDPAIRAELQRSKWEPAQFRATTPDLVVEHNGDDIDGRVVIWFLDEDRPDEFRVVWSTEEPPLRVWWWIVGSIILMVVLAMIVMIEGPAQAKANAAKRKKDS